MDEREQKLISRQLRRSFGSSGVKEICGVKEVMDAFVEMRDGVKLHTYVYMPDSGEKSYPVILTRTCYPGNDRMHRLYGEELAKRGYVYVYQYCRGREQSEGEWIPNIHERGDGIDTVDWLIGNSWCESLGYWGHSYTSMTGWAMADAVEGKVATMYLEDYGTDRFCSAYEKGLFRHDVLTAWSMGNGPVPVDTSYDRYIESCKYMPLSQVDEALWGCVNETFREYIRSPHEEDEIWQSGWWKQLREIPAKVKIPLCVVSGWYDHHHGSSMKTWERLNDEAKQHSMLMINAWNHFFRPCIPGRKTENIQAEEIPGVLHWFEKVLKRKEVPQKTIRFYRIGEDRWVESSDWDDAEGVKVSWYLGGHKEILSEKEWREQDRIQELPQIQEYKYLYDPRNPVMSVGGEALLNSASLIGSLPQPEAGYRSDVLSFVSEPLVEDLAVSGKIHVELYVSSDCEDTAFTAKLMDVDTDGTAYHIRSSVTTLEQETGKEKTYTPGEVIKTDIQMWDIAYTIRKGHKLRLDISSSDFPQYSIHCNYKGLWSEQTATRTASQTVYIGREYPSRIVCECK